MFSQPFQTLKKETEIISKRKFLIEIDRNLASIYLQASNNQAFAM